MTVLFINDCNMNEARNPRASFINIKTDLPINFIEHSFRVSENKQIGAERMGGSWTKILQDLELEYEIVSEGKVSDYTKDKFDIRYKVISGNY